MMPNLIAWLSAPESIEERRGDEWTLEHLDQIPRILRHGRVCQAEYDKVIYHSRRIYISLEGRRCVLRVIIQRGRAGRWYVATFYPWYAG